MRLATLVLAAQAATPSPTPAVPDSMPERLTGARPSVQELFAGCKGGLGTFIVEFTVTSGGRVKDAHVVRGPYCSAAWERMLKAVNGWRYKPARKNGRAIATQLTVTVGLLE